MRVERFAFPLLLATLTAACGIDSDTPDGVLFGPGSGGAAGARAGAAGVGVAGANAAGAGAGPSSTKGGTGGGENPGKGGTGGATSKGGSGGTSSGSGGTSSGSGGKGGAPGKGGAAGQTTAGAGGDDAGGSDAGGSDAGGANAGGSDAGGANAGGSDTGGTNAGGSDTGGTNAGGSDTGGANAGGSDTGGANAGGSDTGGATGAGNGGATNAGNGGATNAGNGGATNAGNGGATSAGNGGATNAGNGGAAGKAGAGGGVVEPICGDGKIDAGEECDGTTGATPLIKCTAKCQLDCDFPGTAYRDKETKTCYFVMPGSYDWNGARAACADGGKGRLATFENAEVRKRVHQGFKPGGANFWVGARQEKDCCLPGPKSDWKWKIPGGDQGIADGAWSADEPNDSNDIEGGEEDCGEALGSNGFLLNDSACGDKRDALCQRALPLDK